MESAVGFPIAADSAGGGEGSKIRGPSFDDSRPGRADCEYRGIQWGVAIRHLKT